MAQTKEDLLHEIIDTKAILFDDCTEFSCGSLSYRVERINRLLSSYFKDSSLPNDKIQDMHFFASGLIEFLVKVDTAVRYIENEQELLNTKI